MIRALYIEDDDLDARQVTRLLRDHADVVLVRRVPTLSEGLAALREHPTDVVLLDLGLPDATAHPISTVLEAAPDTPIVVLTGAGGLERGMEAVAQGAQDFLSKGGLSTDRLLRALHYAIERMDTQTQLRALIARNPDGIVIIDQAGAIQFSNPAGYSLLQSDPARLLGEQLAILPGGTGPREAQLQVPGAEPRSLEFDSSPIHWKGAPASMVTIRDITERKRTMEMERRLMHADRLSTIGKLAAGIAHEVNNPVTYVLTNLHFLRDRVNRLLGLPATLMSRLENRNENEHPTDIVGDALDELRIVDVLHEMRGMVEEGRFGLERVRDITHGLNNFAKMDREAMDWVDINQAVEAASRLADNEIRHRAALVLDLEKIPPVVGDKGRLSQAVLNLLVNAAHAIEAGSAGANTITVRTRLVDQEVILEVVDTGCGIEADDLPRIFDPFYTTKESDSGSGLGLALSAATIRKHGGELTVKSTSGAGSCFRISLPASVEFHREAAKPETSESVMAPRSRVLIVDDEPLVRYTFSRVLASHHTTVEAESGAQALELLATKAPFDLILCDLMMPNIDGPAVYAELEKKHPEMLHKILFVSAGAFTGRARQFAHDVAALVLEKPVLPDVLVATVNRMLAKPGSVVPDKPLLN